MTVRVGSVDLGAAMVERVSMAEIPAVVVPQGEYLRRRLRGPNRIFRITHTFSGGSSDDDDIERLEGYVNTQAAIWMDWSDKWTELQAFGYLASSTMTYRWQNTREVEYTFLEIPAWGRLYMDSVSGYQLHSMDGSDGWTVSVSGGAAPLSLVTSGMKEGYGCVRMTAAAVTSWAKMYYALPRQVDMRQYDGFTFYLRVSSLTNLTGLNLLMGNDSGLAAYYGKNWTTIPRKTGSWYQYGVTRDDMTVGAGAPDWSAISHMFLSITATGGGSNYTGTVDWDDLRLVGVGEDVKLYDLDYPSLGTVGYQARGVQDILSPLCGRYGWTLDRTNKYWQQDFYLVNEALKHVPTTIDDCEATTNWTAGGTAAFPGIATSSTYKKEGSNSIYASSGSCDEAQTLYAQFDSSTLLDLSVADFLCFYLFSTVQGADLTKYSFKVRLTDNAGNWREINLIKITKYLHWYRCVVPLRRVDASSGAISMSAVDHIRFYLTNVSGGNGMSVQIYVDDIAVDNADWAVLELQMPDDMRRVGSTPSASYFYSYYPNGAAYGEFAQFDIGAIAPNLTSDSTATALYSLSDMLQETTYGADDHFLTSPALDLGQQVQAVTNTYGGSLSPLASYQPGTKKRFLIGFKIAPSTESANCDGYTASGLFGIDKLRLRFKPYYATEETTVLD